MIAEQTAVIEQLETVLRAREGDVRKHKDQNSRSQLEIKTLKEEVIDIQTRLDSAQDAYKISQGHNVVSDRRIRELEARLVEREKDLRTALSESITTTSMTEKLRIQVDKANKYRLKYIRAESFRKALVYQKRYLVLLLGGFQECESVTLRAISQIGALPDTAHNDHSSHNPRMRFKRVILAVRAALRLQRLCRQWHDACTRLSQ